ncbi:MAG: class II aldolase [Alphaproteobacteria bacterium]|nr:class II aldolase [Alphaproteobacteria bacterium]
MTEHPSRPSDFSGFVQSSARIGADPLLVQGGGGNMSVKHGAAMWIKASGTWLADAARGDIFVPVDYTALRADIAGGREPVAETVGAANGLRPSIETSMHAALPQRVVVHVHAVGAIALAVRQDGGTQCAGRLADIRHAFIPYAHPGWPLTRAIRVIAGETPPNVIVLGNHGLIVAGESVEETEKLLAESVARLAAPARVSPAPDHVYLQRMARQGAWRVPENPVVHGLANDADACGFACGGTLYPDHAVFLGRGVKVIDAEDFPDADPSAAPLLLVRGKGALLSSALSRAGEAMAECLAQVLLRVPADASLHYLSAADEDRLLDWDAEKHRQALAR